MIRLVPVLLFLLAGAAHAQTREVRPDDAVLTVTIENAEVVPFQQEMVLVTIHGIYRRHITREKLRQPDLEDFNWMQLGEDYWYDSRVDGLQVRNFRRRMALFPERAGTLSIGSFVHDLTFTDEGDDWFDHAIRSEPVSLTVLPAPNGEAWWFPARRLRVSDSWSNAPDQLQPGEGVLRVIQLEAVGAAPEMFPPMPDLTSPSAMIFAHPERRFVELSPEGPVSFAFWRWTIQPTNGTSAILEPIEFSYYNTTERSPVDVSITAQRVAYDASVAAPPPGLPEGQGDPIDLRPGLSGVTAGVAFAGGLVVMLLGRRFSGAGMLLRGPFDPLRRRLRAAARRGDLRAMRRAAHAILRRDGPGNGDRPALLDALDRHIFGGAPMDPNPGDLAGRFLRAGGGWRSATRGKA